MDLKRRSAVGAYFFVGGLLVSLFFFLLGAVE